VVASSRERRTPGPICPQFPCKAPLDIVQPGTSDRHERCHVADRPLLTRGSTGEKCARARACVRDPLQADTRKSPKNDRQHAVRQAGNYNGTGAGG